MLHSLNRLPGLGAGPHRRSTWAWAVTLGLTVLAPLLLWAALAWQSRSQALEAGQVAAHDLAAAVAEQVDKMLATQALALDAAASAAGTRTCAELRQDPALAALLQTLARRTTHTETLWVLDANGMICAASNPARIDARSRAGRDYFAGARDAPTGSYFVGAANVGLIAGVPFFSMARRRGDNGAFGGIVLAAVDLRGLSDYWRGAMKLDPGERIAVLREDGAPIARSWLPLVPPRDVGAEQRIAAAAGRAGVPLGEAPGGLLFGDERVLTAWRRVANGPVIAAAALDEARALAGWRESSARSAGIALLASLALAASAALLWRTQGQLARTNATLEQQVQERTAALATSEARSRGIVTQSFAGIAETDATGRFIDANQRYCDITGYPRDELLLLRMHDITHPDDLAHNQARFERAASASEPFEVEKRYRRKDGTLIWVHNSVFALREPDGSLGSLVAVCVEVTERKLAERRLRASEALLSSVMQQLPVALGVTDSSGQFVRSNAPMDALMPRAIPSTLPERAPLWRIVDEHGAEQPRARWPGARALRGETVVGTEGLYSPPEGARWMSISAAPLRDEAGLITGSIMVVQDIDQRKREQAALHERTQQLEALFASAPLGVAFFDSQHRYLRVNEHLAGINGLPLAAHLGRRLEDVLPPLAAYVAPALDRVFGQGTVVSDMELSGETPREPGVLRHWLSGFYPVRDAGGTVTMAGMWVVEITERKRAEATLRDADRRKDEFLATLAHELRNPLAPVRNSLHLLRLGAGNDERVLDMLERQVQHIVRLVDELMEVSRITRGKVDLKRELVDLRGVMSHALEAAGTALQAAGLRPQVQLPAAPLLLDADPVRLAQVLGNLLHNAAKYSEPGGTVWLSAHEDGSDAVLEVRDDGVGIPAEMLPRVFELFTQVDRTLGRAQGGLGIGLALVERLVQLHGGTVTAHSDGPGRGSTFTLRLPLAAGGAAPAHRRECSTVQPAALSGLRIVVCDDNRDAADSLVAVLAHLGAEARSVYSGLAALDAVRAWVPDVLFLDLGMPGMSGFEVAAQLRAEPLPGRLHIVALTGWGQETDRERTLAGGFDTHCTKPLEPGAIVPLLASLQGA